MLNAIGNAFRKKGGAFRELWRKVKEITKEQTEDDLKTIEAIEAAGAAGGTDWINLVRKNAGLPPVSTDKKG